MNWCNQVSSSSLFTKNKSTSGNGLNNAAQSTTFAAVDGAPEDAFPVNILSFNVLAESYLTPRSHKGLPEQYAKVVFNKEERKKMLLRTLKSFTGLLDEGFESCFKNQAFYDILCLQEVDMYDDCVAALSAFDSCHSKIEGRTDRCAIFWRKGSYELMHSEIVDFDKVGKIMEKTNHAEERTDRKFGDEIEKQNKSKPTKKGTTTLALKGMISSFLRRNTASIAILRHKKSKKKIVVSSAHLYWNPGFEYVKLVQAKYLLDRLNQLATINSEGNDCSGRIPVFVCGDFNAKPGSAVHSFLSQGIVDPRDVAPWNFSLKTNGNDKDEWNNSRASGYTSGNQERNTIIAENKELREKLRRISFLNWQRLKSSDNQCVRDAVARPDVKYMVDFTLNKFTRWLRILGLDTALETEQEEKERTRPGAKETIPIFEHCRNEGRVLLTTSVRLLHRKDCPPGAYLINPNELEKSLCHILLLHGVVLRPETFITRCVVCNGSIIQINDIQTREKILEVNKAPPLNDLPVFACDFCLQCYWWSQNPNSSASRVKNTASWLFTLALSAGVPYEGELGIFDFISSDVEKMGHEWDFPRVEALEWLKESKLNHVFTLQSAYAGEDRTEMLPFTNVTADFVGTLDYIFFEPEYCIQLERLDVPTTFHQLNSLGVHNGHLIPSNCWPSDHIAIGATFVLKKSLN